MSFNEAGAGGAPCDGADSPFRTRTGEGTSRRPRKGKGKPRSSNAVRTKHLEEMMSVLFRLHDLNSNGLLEEEELVQLNSKVAMLHYGKDTDLVAVKAKYRALFREKLDAEGRPVPYPIFRRYVLQVLDGLDPDPLAQEMIVEQFSAEARSARAVFHVDSFASSSDQKFLSKLSIPSFPSVVDEPVSYQSASQGSSPSLPSAAHGRLLPPAATARAAPTMVAPVKTVGPQSARGRTAAMPSASAPASMARYGGA